MRVDCKTSGTGWDAEPWHLWVEHGIIYSGECGQNEPWVHSGGFQVGTFEDTEFSNDKRDQQNAARAVACVNACAGIADPASVLREVREAMTRALNVVSVNAPNTFAMLNAALAKLPKENA